jgi:tetratricopeptide (TPR) repeat protein
VKKTIIQFGVAAIALTICTALGLTCFAPAAAAQKDAAVGSISGIIKDEQNKPIEGAIVLITSIATGVEVQAKTDAAGKYSQAGLAGGMYDLTFMVNDEAVYKGELKVAAGHDNGVNVSLSDPEVKAYREKIKAFNEERKRANSTKEHYDAATAALTQTTDLHKILAQTPADQKDALKAKIQTAATQAIEEFQQTLKIMGEDAAAEDKRTIYGQMASAYDAEEKYDDEATVLKMAAEINPPAAGYYNNLGNALAKAGKIEEARAAYDKSAGLDPKSAPQAYRNLGVILFNAGQLANPGVVDVMKKATELDPNNAQGWFLLGAALAANIQNKQEGDKMTFIILPGTVEAYQKCLELSPTGPLAQQARDALDGLKAMGASVDLKIVAPKTKH